MKKTSAFFCKECGYESARWLGQCPACKAWNSMVEEQVKTGTGGSTGKYSVPKTQARACSINEVCVNEKERHLTGFSELDRVLGGGIVQGSLTLVGGDPGIGKSTLLLQVCRNMAGAGKKILYVSGEESLGQIKMRADRIGSINGDLKFLCETSLSDIQPVILDEKPDLAIIDSIQTMYSDTVESAPGSVSQVREATNIFMQLAKTGGTAVILVGHVTKEGQVAGPRLLEHMVDTVLYFEGERSAPYRILRAVKNRFGSTNEIGIFEMKNEGLAEVANPSEYMLSGRPEGSSGTVVSCAMEGTRPVLLEVQALVNKTNFGLPRRTANGADYNRVNLLMAVLEKRCRFPMSELDVYVNIAGGIRMSEPAIDLAMAMAVVSSCKDIPIDGDTVIFGEIGLSGEIRTVSMGEQRIKEAERLGFKRAIVPESIAKKIKSGYIDIIGVKNLSDAISCLIR